MKKNNILLIFTFLLLGWNSTKAQTIWTGPKITFTKANNANPTTEAAQDRITDKVWITRGISGWLFNAVSENNYGDNSPSDTEWAYGTAANYATLTFQTFKALIGNNFKSIVDDRNMVLHLISEDIYIDLKFLSWQSGNGGGGGFSYERSTEGGVLNTREFDLDKTIQLFPNPSSNFIQLSGLTKNENYKIYTILGTKLTSGVASNKQVIDIRNLTSGLYFLKFDNGNAFKFIKE